MSPTRRSAPRAGSSAEARSAKAEARSAKGRLRQGSAAQAGLVARSAAMRELVEQVRRFALADANVLITGETGAGKDAVALALHALGPRRTHPFVKIDCPSLPQNLIESELFGHERGAFTDATAARPGRFEMAGRGTVYLDAVGELPLDAQAKILRLVEDKRGERLGGTATYAVHARIVASADSLLETAVRDGAFREDLYHRLRVLPLRIPPLRERREDIVPLARAFARDAALRHGRGTVRVAGEAASVLERYDWPGNVRELKHVVERAVLWLERGQDQLRASELPAELFEDTARIYEVDTIGQPTLDEVERRYIELVLRRVKHHQGEAARILGISRKALWEKRRRYGLK